MNSDGPPERIIEKDQYEVSTIVNKAGTNKRKRSINDNGGEIS